MKTKRLLNRRSIRLPEYDYNQPGAYLVTICVQGKEHLPGKIMNGEIRLTKLGQIADAGINQLPSRFPSIEIPIFSVMPSHIHCIMANTNIGRGGVTPPSANQGEGTSPLPKDTLGKIVGFYKYQTTKQINQARNTPGIRFWQRNYYERVIRNDRELQATYDYIIANPTNWEQDEYR